MLASLVTPIRNNIVHASFYEQCVQPGLQFAFYLPAHNVAGHPTCLFHGDQSALKPDLSVVAICSVNPTVCDILQPVLS